MHNEARNRGELTLFRIIPIGLLILGIAGFGYFAWNMAQREQRLYPANITIEARPGAAVVLPFKRRLERAQKNMPSVIHGSALTDPNPLPAGLEVLYSNVLFKTSGASGDVLIWLPPEALGEIEFSIAASADASTVGAGAPKLNSDKARVTLTVSGAPVAGNEPALAGDWSDGGHKWTFAADANRQLTIANSEGAATFSYDLYPDQTGRWFLAEIKPEQPRLYWIGVEGDVLKVSWAGDEFKPIMELRRSKE